MAQQNTIGRVHTTRGMDNDTGFYTVQYHATKVVQFNDEIIKLNHGGYKTATTKTRMNQASNEFRLGYHVFQKDGRWYVQHKGDTNLWDGESITLIR